MHHPYPHPHPCITPGVTLKGLPLPLQCTNRDVLRLRDEGRKLGGLRIIGVGSGGSGIGGRGVGHDERERARKNLGRWEMVEVEKKKTLKSEPARDPY